MYVVVCDIDSTIADPEHRLHYVKKDPPDWAAFLSVDEVSKDKKIVAAEKPLKYLLDTCADFFFLTSREDYLRDVTSFWLEKAFDIEVEYSRLIMRPTGQNSPASDHKFNSFNRLIRPKIPMNLPILLFDDDAYVLSRMRGAALTFKAPECWEVMWYGPPKIPESTIAV